VECRWNPDGAKIKEVSMIFKKSAALLALGLCILLSAGTLHAEPETDRGGTISVTGTSSEEYPPDTAEMVLAIETSASTVTFATNRNRTKTEKVLAALDELINREEGDTIKTSTYSLYPEYEYDQLTKKNKLKGYKVVNQITIKVKDIENIGKLVDSATSEGANRVHNIRFSLSDDIDYCKFLLEKATERARSEAEVVAQAFGLNLMGIKDASISCGSETPKSVYRLERMAREEVSRSRAMTPVEAGTIRLQGTVKAVFSVERQ
jgi:uncharacterized protein YggE